MYRNFSYFTNVTAIIAYQTAVPEAAGQPAGRIPEAARPQVRATWQAHTWLTGQYYLFHSSSSPWIAGLSKSLHVIELNLNFNIFDYAIAV